jgi:hypothetical protein
MRELVAVGILVENHRDELRDIIAGRAGAASLDARRRERAVRRRRG